MNKDYLYIYEAVKKLNKNASCRLNVKNIIQIGDTSYKVIINDEDMQERMEKAKSSFHFIDYVPNFVIELSQAFWLGNVLYTYDKAVGITSNMNHDDKIILRIAFRLWVKWKDWRGDIFKNHEELK